MKSIPFMSLVLVFLMGNAMAAPSDRVTFDTSEGDEPAANEVLNFPSESEKGENGNEEPPRNVETNVPGSGFFPSETALENTTVGEIKAPEGIIPAGETEGRTFHHLAKLHYKIDRTVSHLFHKLISPWIPTVIFAEEPHHYPQYPYYGDEHSYRKEDIYEPNKYSSAQKPVGTAQHHYVDPFNFKQALTKLHHSLGKRSVDAQIGDEATSRQGKTLYKIIPNFEQNFGALMRRVFGPLYGSNQVSSNPIYKSGLEKPTPTYSSFMQILREISRLMALPN